MRFLNGLEKDEAELFMRAAQETAKKAGCQRAQCGSVLVSKGRIIGKGYNSPPAELESQRRCTADKKEIHTKVSDKTCCIHAEQRAIIAALKNKHELVGSTIYFTRIDASGQIVYSGKPYCTVCSKLALETGVKEFVLWHDDGLCSYDTEEYNLLSFTYTD
jgi:deoxycytidylate deaminase